MKSKVKILELICKNPQIPIHMIAEATGLSVGGVEKNIRQLKKDGILTHAGSARNGHWEIISANVDEKEMK